MNQQNSMTDIHSVIRNLKSKNQVPENLKKYEALAKKEAYRFSLTGFTLYYLSLYEGIRESEADCPAFDTLNSLVKQYFEDGEEVDASLVSALRQENRSRMEQATNAVDLFTVDEYLLNRIEHNFEGAQTLPYNFSDTDLTDRLMSWLSRHQEEEQNLNIVRLIEQLPVRMTKNRFFEAVHDRLSIYQESDKTAFLNQTDAVRSASGLKLSENEDASLSGLMTLNSRLKTADLSAVTEAEYRELSGQLTLAGTLINEQMDLGTALQDALNGFLAMLLSDTEEKQFEQEEICKEIILKVLRSVEDPSIAEENLDETYELCEQLEGIQEEALPRLQEALGFTETLKAEFDADLSDLDAIDVLTSNSAFGDITDRPDQEAEEMDPAFFEKTVSGLIQDLKTLFEGANKNYIRAVMAHVFSVLPPHFSTQEELENYIYGSLSGCTNTAEKLGLLDVLEELMRE